MKISRCLPRTHKRKVGLYLLSKYSANPCSGIGELYGAAFADNRQYVVGADATGAVKRRSVRRSAKTARHTLPANEMLEERYAVSVATRNKAESLRLARLLYQQEPANLTRTRIN